MTRESYTPEISIRFVEGRTSTLDEERAHRRKKEIKKCPNFANAIKGYTKPKKEEE